MITILTQNKVAIIDCERLKVGKNEDGYCIISSYSVNDFLYLGAYTTAERAREVLTEIWEVIENVSKGYCELSTPLYIMPKE